MLKNNQLREMYFFLGLILVLIVIFVNFVQSIIHFLFSVQCGSNFHNLCLMWPSFITSFKLLTTKHTHVWMSCLIVIYVVVLYSYLRDHVTLLHSFTNVNATTIGATTRAASFLHNYIFCAFASLSSPSHPFSCSRVPLP